MFWVLVQYISELMSALPRVLRMVCISTQFGWMRILIQISQSSSSMKPTQNQRFLQLIYMENSDLAPFQCSKIRLRVTMFNLVTQSPFLIYAVYSKIWYHQHYFLNPQAPSRLKTPIFLSVVRNGRFMVKMRILSIVFLQHQLALCTTQQSWKLIQRFLSTFWFAQH